MTDEPDVINVMGMPDGWVREVWEKVKHERVLFMCDTRQYQMIERWKAEEGADHAGLDGPGAVGGQAMTIYVDPLDVQGMTNAEIGKELREMAEDFPFTGSNYAEEILIEAARRVRAIEEAGNR